LQAVTLFYNNEKLERSTESVRVSSMVTPIAIW